MSMKIDASQLSDTIQDALSKYHVHVTQNIKMKNEEATKKLYKATKRDAPEDTGKFKKSISYKKTLETALSSRWVWFVKDPHYRLTHLLVHGHDLVVGTGPKNATPKKVGFVKARDFLSKNVHEVQTEYIKAVKEICENGR